MYTRHHAGQPVQYSHEHLLYLEPLLMAITEQNREVVYFQHQLSTTRMTIRHPNPWWCRRSASVASS